MTAEQMDALIAQYQAAFPRDFGDDPTWELQERIEDAERHTAQREDDES